MQSNLFFYLGFKKVLIMRKRVYFERWMLNSMDLDILIIKKISFLITFRGF